VVPDDLGHICCSRHIRRVGHNVGYIAKAECLFVKGKELVYFRRSQEACSSSFQAWWITLNLPTKQENPCCSVKNA
jgi:hypothetical protein